MRWLVIAVLALLLAAGAWIITGLADFDTPDGETITFNAGPNRLSGTLFPAGPDAPVAIFVHGDGPQDRLSDGGYLPLIHALLDAGIGVFSWDKPGIGDSTGDWLDQTMEDRSAEAQAARTAVMEATGLPAQRIGYLGFSQAGWVLPRIARDDAPPFTVLIGPAVNLRAQGRYFEGVRLRLEGLPEPEITRELDARDARYDALFARDPAPDGETSRQRFIRRAYTQDARTDIAEMQGPVLAMWGRDDLNVDAPANAAIWAKHLPAAKIILTDHASHGLLRAPLFNDQLTSEWPRPKLWLFLAMGRRAYAPGALDLVTEWIEQAVAP